MASTETTFKALQKLSTAAIMGTAIVLLADEAAALQAMIDNLIDASQSRVEVALTAAGREAMEAETETDNGKH